MAELSGKCATNCGCHLSEGSLPRVESDSLLSIGLDASDCFDFSDSSPALGGERVAPWGEDLSPDAHPSYANADAPIHELQDAQVTQASFTLSSEPLAQRAVEVNFSREGPPPVADTPSLVELREHSRGGSTPQVLTQFERPTLTSPVIPSPPHSSTVGSGTFNAAPTENRPTLTQAEMTGSRSLHQQLTRSAPETVTTSTAPQATTPRSRPSPPQPLAAEHTPSSVARERSAVSLASPTSLHTAPPHPLRAPERYERPKEVAHNATRSEGPAIPRRPPEGSSRSGFIGWASEQRAVDYTRASTPGAPSTPAPRSIEVTRARGGDTASIGAPLKRDERVVTPEQGRSMARRESIHPTRRDEVPPRALGRALNNEISTTLNRTVERSVSHGDLKQSSPLESSGKDRGVTRVEVTQRTVTDKQALPGEARQGREGRLSSQERAIPHRERATQATSPSRDAQKVAILERVERVISRLSSTPRATRTEIHLTQLDLATRILELLEVDEESGVSTPRSRRSRRLTSSFLRKRRERLSTERGSSVRTRERLSASYERPSQRAQAPTTPLTLSSITTRGAKNPAPVRDTRAPAATKSLDIFQSKTDDDERSEAGQFEE